MDRRRYSQGDESKPMIGVRISVGRKPDYGQATEKENHGMWRPLTEVNPLSVLLGYLFAKRWSVATVLPPRTYVIVIYIKPFCLIEKFD